MSKNQAEGGFFSHLTELRKRLIHSLIFLTILFVSVMITGFYGGLLVHVWEI